MCRYIGGTCRRGSESRDPQGPEEKGRTLPKSAGLKLFLQRVARKQGSTIYVRLGETVEKGLVYCEVVGGNIEERGAQL